MSNSEKLIRSLQEGEHDEILRQLYALDGKDSSLRITLHMPLLPH